MNRGHAVAATLLAGRDGHGLPVRLLLGGALAGRPQHAALGQQRLDGGDPQLRGFSTSQSMRSLAGMASASCTATAFSRSIG